MSIYGMNKAFSFYFHKRRLKPVAKTEGEYKTKLIKRIKGLFPGCFVLKNDANYIQGFPDLTVLYEDKWALLEAKRESEASHRPNQDFYISKADQMSFARFICHENKEEVLCELQQAFRS